MNTLIDICAGSEIYTSSSLKDIVFAIKKFNADNIFIVCDSITRKACYPLLQKLLPAHILIVMSQGEQHKNIDSANKIWKTLLKHNAGKQSLIIALGGGMVSDVTGFTASVYKRGIPTIYIPTSLLSMADAAIGGKTGIDYNEIKNVLGTFYQPSAVYVYYGFLKTLREAHINNGMAEIIKMGAVWNPELFYDIIDSKKLLYRYITTAIHSKSSVVNADIQDTYTRRILNFGHTLGHAIESTYMGKKTSLMHGEAIALGMIGEAYLSYKLLGMPIEDLDDILYVLNKWHIVKKVNVSAQAKNIVTYCLQDKKNNGKIIQCVLLKTIGAPVIDVPIAENDIKQALVYTENYLQSL